MLPRNRESERAPHPSIFLILYAPPGIAFGYVTVAVAYSLSQAGLSVSEVASLVALCLLPQTWKILWAPIIDTTLTAKRWYRISVLGTGSLILAIALASAAKSSVWLLDLLVLALSFVCSVAAMSTENLMAYLVAPHQRGRAGGWMQAGNLGGMGIGGGAGLWLAQHIAPWCAGIVLGITCVLSCGALARVAQPIRPTVVATYRATLEATGKDVWSVLRSRAGLLVLLLYLLPLGTTAADNLWAAVAGDWRVSADMVALVDGVMGGLISVAGCLVGGYLCDLIDRKSAYALCGTALALCAACMGSSAKTPFMFVVFTSIYSFIGGMIYASFAGLTLEVIGKGAAATKFNLLGCAANVAVVYLTLVDGWTQSHWGSSAMLFTEATLGVASAAIFMALVRSQRFVTSATGPAGAIE
jgi:MFS transporter, PAT family, beta-lactamase induction signal transducer AmpG